MPGDPRASRVTTAILIAALVVVVLITGVLGTIAVLMTRNPDVPLGSTPPRRLAVPVHFAQVIGTQAGPCTTPEAIPDDQGQICYTVAAGVSVNAVRKIEAIQEKSGAYSVRIALAPAFREQINDLTQEAVKQQMAIVVGEKVVAAPLVAQAITEDSLSIAGSFTKEQADAMVARLLGGGDTGDAGTPATGGAQPTSSIFTPSEQSVAPPITPAPAPATTPAPTASATGLGATRPGAARSATAPATTAPDGTRIPDRRFPSCEAAVKEGYGGPYQRGVHEEYEWYVDRDRDGVACDTET